jgi:hypothetical protein
MPMPFRNLRRPICSIKNWPLHSERIFSQWEATILWLSISNSRELNRKLMPYSKGGDWTEE